MISCTGAFLSETYSNNQNIFMLIMISSVTWLIILVNPNRFTQTTKGNAK